MLRRQKLRRARLNLLLMLMVSLILAGVVLLFWSSRHPATQQANRGAAVSGVASVVDGDTLEIHGVKIRLFGVDAPESTQSCTRGGQSYACGREAAHQLSAFLGQQTVTCRKRDTDRYGRTVAVCYRGKVDVNGWLVGNGLALAYREYSTDYVPQENAARRAKRGLHAGTFVNPADYRKGDLTPQAPVTARAPYGSCAEARAAGKTPVLKGEPGFNPKLDGDRDGKMCE